VTETVPAVMTAAWWMISLIASLMGVLPPKTCTQTA
jgi:hypothetical protein